MFGHRHSANYLGLALHTIVLMDPLVELEDYRYVQKTGKVDQFTKTWRRIDPTSLFPISDKDRADFTKLAANLKYFLPEELNKLAKSRTMFTREHEYQEYEFYDFFANFYKHTKNAEARIKEMEQIGGGATLEDHEPLIKFLSSLNSCALSCHNNQRGGCF